ncbi:flagellar basal body-associated FliL family protein [Halomonas binhaiensis]|uniref:Flagellar protein FliL n=1 Tax=Halomonas binhaiensis TaxID=2562282 RepID=A0A5C1NNP9_9GAMM|nr:flagellar basal body-associated FliL family protein [Halomonas binhaiensis]QEM83825.1 flagellar basal body-associated FliL family protein [Halomonas binhaiensis]
MAKSRWLIRSLIVVVVLALASTAIAVYLLLQERAETAQPPASDSPAITDKADTPPADPVYLALQPLTVNLADDGDGPRMLYAGITLELASEADRDALQQQLPQVQDCLLKLLSGHKAEDLVTPQGKQQLADDIAQRLCSDLAESSHEAKIIKVLFTQFIVQ